MHTNLYTVLAEVLGQTRDSDLIEKNVFVLTTNNLQKWHLACEEEEKLLCSCDLATIG